MAKSKALSFSWLWILLCAISAKPICCHTAAGREKHPQICAEQSQPPPQQLRNNPVLPCKQSCKTCTKESVHLPCNWNWTICAKPICCPPSARHRVPQRTWRGRARGCYRHLTDEFEKQPAVTGRVGTVRCEFCLPRHEIWLGSADVADLKRIHNFWEKLVFCCIELLKYCRNVANVKTFWYNEVVPKNRHQYYSGDVINSDANPDVAINIYRSSTNSMPEVNLKNLIGNKFADVVITRSGTSYSVGPRAGIGTRYLQRTSSISNSGGGQYMR